MTPEDERWLRDWKCVTVKRDEDGRIMQPFGRQPIPEDSCVEEVCKIGEAFEKSLAEAEKRRRGDVPEVRDNEKPLRGGQMLLGERVTRLLLCFILVASMACAGGPGNGLSDSGPLNYNPAYINATSPYYDPIPQDGLVAAYRKGDYHLNSGNVDVWYDRVGGYNASQPITLLQPTVNASGGIYFPLSGQLKTLKFPSSLASRMNNYFSVVFRMTYPTYNSFANLFATDALDYGFFHANTDGRWRIGPGSYFLGLTTPLFYPSNNRGILAVTCPIGSSKTIRGWDMTNTDSLTNSNVGTGLYVVDTYIMGAAYSGSAYGLGAYVSDFWVYDRVLTDPDIAIFRSLP